MHRLVILPGLLALATPAFAQDAADDWDLGRDPAHKVTIAAVTFENFGVAVRCMDEVMSVIVSGVPAGKGLRQVGFQMNDAETRSSSWVTGADGTTLFSVWPASMATELRKGGRLALTIPDGETGHDRRIVADLPESRDAVAQVFHACNREAPGEIENHEPSGVDLGRVAWAHMPQPQWPRDAEAIQGLAALNCTVKADGSLRACRVESEFPVGSGFGRAATYGSNRTGRVRLADGETGSMDGAHIAFVVNYMMGDFGDLPPTPSRLQPNPGAHSAAPPH